MNTYLPEKEKPKSNHSIYRTVSSEDLADEDFLLSNFDFTGKICVVSGGSDEKKEFLKSKLKEVGAKVAGSISGKTDVFIKGEDVGPSKKKKAKIEKEKRPDVFHIFTQEGVAKRIDII